MLPLVVELDAVRVEAEPRRLGLARVTLVAAAQNRLESELRIREHCNTGNPDGAQSLGSGEEDRSTADSNTMLANSALERN